MKTRYFLSVDYSMNYVLIPTTKSEDWYDWVDDNENITSPKLPKYAIVIESGSIEDLEFENPSERLINGKQKKLGKRTKTV